MKAGADGFRRPFQLIDQIRIDRIHHHGFVFQTIAQNRNLSDIVAGIILFPIILQAFGRFIIDRAGCAQNAAGIGIVAKELGGIIENIQTLRGRQSASRDGD